MPSRLEIALQDHLADPEGEGIRKKARAYFGIEVSRIRAVQILTIDAGLSADQLKLIQNDIFTNPVTQVSSDRPLGVECDVAREELGNDHHHEFRDVVSLMKTLENSL